MALLLGIIEDKKGTQQEVGRSGASTSLKPRKVADEVKHFGMGVVATRSPSSR